MIHQERPRGFYWMNPETSRMNWTVPEGWPHATEMSPDGPSETTALLARVCPGP